MQAPYDVAIIENQLDNSKGEVMVHLGGKTYHTFYEWGSLAGAWITTSCGDLSATKFVRFLFDPYISFMLSSKEKDVLPLSAGQIEKINNYHRLMEKLVEYTHQKMLTALDEEAVNMSADDTESQFYLARAYAVEEMFYFKAKTTLAAQGALKTYHALADYPAVVDPKKAPVVEELIHSLHTLGQQFLEKVAHTGKFRVDNTTTKTEIECMYKDYQPVLKDLEATKSDIPFLAFFQEAEVICAESIDDYNKQLDFLLALHGNTHFNDQL